MINVLNSNKNYLAGGADSIVYLLKDNVNVMKIYSKFMNDSGLGTVEDCLNIIHKYSQDTIKAAKILESEWHKAPEETRKISFKGYDYDLSISILPQGRAKILEDDVVSIGQKYFSERTYAHILAGTQYPDFLYRLIYEKHNELSLSILYATDIINNNLNSSFSIAPVNVKPILDKSTKKLDLIVTDLASSLIRSYGIKTVFMIKK